MAIASKGTATTKIAAGMSTMKNNVVNSMTKTLLLSICVLFVKTLRILKAILAAGMFCSLATAGTLMTQTLLQQRF